MDAAETESVPARILRAAARLFRGQGYAVTTMRDIADAVGLSKAGLYHHYSRKEDLLNDVAEGGTQALMAQLRAVQATDLDPVAKLRECVRTRMAAIADYQDMLTVIWQERPIINQVTFAKIAQQLEGYRSGVTDLIEEARAVGGLREDVDTHLLMLAIDGVTGWSYLWMRPGQRYSPAEIGDRFWDFLYAGVGCPRLGPTGAE